LKDGKKSIKTNLEVYRGNISKKKVDLENGGSHTQGTTKSMFHPNSFNSYGMNLNGTFNEKVIPCLEFTMEFQSNQLIYQKEYTKRQQIIYILIHHLHNMEGWRYRKISKWLNQSGIKTLRGKN